MGAALDGEAAGQKALRFEPLFDAGLHRVPDVIEEVPDALPFNLGDVFPKAQVVFHAKRFDVGKRRVGVDVLRGGGGLALHLDGAAAHAHHAPAVKGNPLFERGQIHRVRMGQLLRLFIQDNGDGKGRKGLVQNAVGSMSLAGLGQRSIECHQKGVCFRVGGEKAPRRAVGPHGVGAGRAAARFIELGERLHGVSSCCPPIVEKAHGGYCICRAFVHSDGGWRHNHWVIIPRKQEKENNQKRRFQAGRIG